MHARRKRLALLTTRYADQLPVARGKHSITDLEVFPLREPVSRRAYTLIRVRTDSGLIGYGECAAAPRNEVERLRHSIIGRAATANVGTALGSPMDGAVNCALLDIVGHACSAPLYRVLGGPTRYKVRAMTSLEGPTNAQLVACVESAVNAGFRGFVVPIPAPAARNQGQAYVKEVRARLEALRFVSREGIDFVLDGGGQLSAGDAETIAAGIEGSHPLWFDEPCSMSNPERIQRIAEQTVTPLGFGRMLPNPAAFQDFLRMEIMDVARPDILREGILGIRRIAALAETYYVTVAPHHEGGPVATAAAIHLAASLPNFFIQHIPFPGGELDQAMRSELLSQPVEEVKEGFLPLPSGPGLGVSVNEKALDKYKDSEL